MTRRILIIAAFVGGLIALAAGQARAGHDCAIQTLTSPSSGAAVRGTTAISWTSGPHCAPVETVSVKVSSDSGSTFQTLSSSWPADAAISWDTTTGADAATYVVEVVLNAAPPSSRATGPFTVDNSAPAIALESQTPANAAGWNSEDVTVVWSCSDGGSGALASSVSETLTGQGPGQEATGTCEDLAGNTASATVGSINIDKSAPVITFDGRTLANAAGWNDGDVNLHWSCFDVVSAAIEETIDETVSAEGAGQSVSATCEDLAGNTASDTQGDVNIDLTDPTTTFEGRTPANADGWNAGDVTLDWSCSDALSGAAQAALSQTLSAEGAGQSATATCADLAGNTASDTRGEVNIDLTDPTITFVERTEPNANGWNAGDVTATWSCGDGLSGPADAGVSDVVSSEGANQSASATCADLAGNTAGASIDGVNVDTSAPNIAFAGRTAANAAGWNNEDVTVDWTCSDDVSDVVEAALSKTVSAEGPAQSAAATCEDLAGNTADDTVGDINIDKTVPVTTINALEVPIRLSVLGDTLTGEAIDNLSGVAGVVVTFTDELGNATVRDATCACGGLTATWSVDTAGLLPGLYTATASSDDVADNGGAASAPATMVIV